MRGCLWCATVVTGKYLCCDDECANNCLDHPQLVGGLSEQDTATLVAQISGEVQSVLEFP